MKAQAVGEAHTEVYINTKINYRISLANAFFLANSTKSNL